MKTPFPKKLFFWLIERSLGGLFLVLLIFFICFWIFDFTLSMDFLMGVLLGAAVLFPIFYSLFRSLLRTIALLMEKMNRLLKEENPSNEEEDSFAREMGEFYDINKALNQLYNHLRQQKKIISRESSELEAVISAVSGAIVAVDQNQKILFFNTQAALLFDQHKKPKKQDLFLSELVRNPDILKCYERSLKEGWIIKKKLPIDLPGLEETRNYEITVAPLKEAGPSVQGAVGLFYDITNITKTEQLHVDFISNVSHELRTPLTAIHGYVQTLLEELKENKTEKLESFLKIINRNVKRLVSLLNHFLELAQMDSHIDLKREELSTEEITRSIIQDLHIENHKLKLEFSAKKVTADRHFLKQVLYNLIDNAIRYVPKGRLIEILWRKAPQAVVLTVKDHGEGIPREHRDRLFERFYRADPARTSTTGVSGIGLSIVKQLLEKHGGSIKLGKETRRGSEFTCVFPDK